MVCNSATSNPVRPIGSAVTLTCIVCVKLEPAVDVPVILNTVWTGPNGFTATNISQPIFGINSTTYISKAIISSFGRTQSGVYTCMATLNASSSTPYLIDSITTSESIQVTTGEIVIVTSIIFANTVTIHFIGVYLALRNQFIANNTQINIRSIGQYSDNPNGALQCITDRKPCCYNPNHRYGEWYLPNGMLVHIRGIKPESDVEFYRNRGDNGRVYLNCPTNNDITAMTPTGRFCCEVPDATDTNQTLCVIIGNQPNNLILILLRLLSSFF